MPPPHSHPGSSSLSERRALGELSTSTTLRLSLRPRNDALCAANACVLRAGFRFWFIATAIGSSRCGGWRRVEHRPDRRARRRSADGRKCGGRWARLLVVRRTWHLRCRMDQRPRRRTHNIGTTAAEGTAALLRGYRRRVGCGYRGARLRPEVWSDHATQPSRGSSHRRGRRLRRDGMQEQLARVDPLANAEPIRDPEPGRLGQRRIDVDVDACRRVDVRVHLRERSGVCGRIDEPGELVVGVTFGAGPCCRGRRRDQRVLTTDRRSSFIAFWGLVRPRPRRRVGAGDRDRPVRVRPGPDHQHGPRHGPDRL
jgi:hypothetical protein